MHRVSTRVCFAVHSDVLSLEELQARIGMPPSSVTRKAATHADPPRPAVNAWKIDSPLSPSAPLWQHLEALFKVIAPASATIADVCRGEPGACLQIVREFFPADGEADLGFWLDEPWLAVIRQTGALIDVDEYDYAAGQDQAKGTGSPR
jgi:Domain of unknown function (DUF4279)